MMNCPRACKGLQEEKKDLIGKVEHIEMERDN